MHGRIEVEPLGSLIERALRVGPDVMAERWNPLLVDHRATGYRIRRRGAIRNLHRLRRYYGAPPSGCGTLFPV